MESKTNLITILEERSILDIKKNWLAHLIIQEEIIRRNFDWIVLVIDGYKLSGKGQLFVNEKKYVIEIKYSPFYPFRMDRIRVMNQKIKFHNSIHVYPDCSLCLYHPYIDKPYNKEISLFNMIPWIVEWCHFYEEWKKYGVWLAKEIKHDDL